MNFKDLFGKVSSSFSSTEDTTQEPKKQLGELGIDKLKSVIAEVTAAFPLFEKAGFSVDEVQVEIGMMPKLMPRFKLEREISIEEQESLLADVADKKLVKFILISLFKSTKMKNLINDPKLDFYAIEIDLTAVPSVRGIFRASNNVSNVIRLNTQDIH